MKKLLLTSILMAFALASQASTEKTSTSAKACCSQQKAACCLKEGDQAKAGCCKGAVAAKKVQSPKAKTLASK